MIFNSLTFLFFLLLVYCAYWALPHRKQNLLLLLASYVFYGWWDWRFLSLIFASSVLDYWIGLRIETAPTSIRRKCYLALTLCSNLGLLGFFKYFNFFASSFAHVLTAFGLQASFSSLQIILPVGISFYTFKTLSYNIDVYRKECPAHHDLLEFLAFISFFPELVAGPIMRATNLMEQFVRPRSFDTEIAKDGARVMLWGYFQKVVIADGLSGYVNRAYAHAQATSGAGLLLATYFFAFQIYCDFSAYSNIAFGVARLFGFTLVRNFAYPYFSRNIAEFWQRWHISLSTWFRDYLYIPLGGNRCGLPRALFNVLVTFTVSGLWHGASWTFMLWGVLNGFYFVPILLRRRLARRERGALASQPQLRDIAAIAVTFHLVLVAWVLFRAENLNQAALILSRIILQFNLRSFLLDALPLKTLIIVLLILEWLQRYRLHPFEFGHWPRPVRWGLYNVAAFTILLLGTFNYTPFIYFQF